MRTSYTRLLLALAAGVLVAAAGPASAQDAETEKGLEQYRKMLKDDPWANPAMLDVDRGEALWKAPRGPKNASLEQCDLGKNNGAKAYGEDACTVSCRRAPYCGDGRIQTAHGEECDSTPGCGNNCRLVVPK